MWLRPIRFFTTKVIERPYQPQNVLLKYTFNVLIVEIFSHFSPIHQKFTSTYSLIVIIEPNRAASTSGIIQERFFEQNYVVSIVIKEKKQPNFNSGVEIRNIGFCNERQVKHYTFKTFMRRLSWTFKSGAEKVFTKEGKKLFCFLKKV